MATALIITFTSFTRDGEVSGITSQSITFVTPEAAAKALARIDENCRKTHSGAVVVDGTIIADVII